MDALSLASAYLASGDVSRSTLGSGATQALSGFLEAYRPSTRVVYVPHDPYVGSFERMRDQVRSTGTLLVYSGHSEGLAFDTITNLRFRAWHDLCSHLGPDGGCGFDLAGEREAWRRAASVLPGLAWLLFSEVVCQAAYVNAFGTFPAQRIVRFADSMLERWR